MSDPRKYLQLVDGRWQPALSGAEFSRQSPFSGEVVGTYPDSNEADAELAIQAARRAFDSGTWSDAPARERARMLRRASQLMLDRVDAFATVISLEMGKPIARARGEVQFAADLFEYYAAANGSITGESFSVEAPDAIGVTLREPVGVAGLITPWNFPLQLLSLKVAPALAAGCTVVAKPSHHASGCALLLGEVLLEAGLPDGVINILTSQAENGAVVGQRIAASDAVDKIAFTGSTETGRAVMRAAATNVKRISLELGGKSPNIVFEDAPLEEAARAALFGVFLNSGQICQAGTRLLVAARIKDEFLSILLDGLKQWRMGDPLDPTTTLGPIVTVSQLEKVENYIAIGRGEAKLVAGGERPVDTGLAGGLFVTPTVFDEVPSSACIAQEEIFGPVLSILTFDTAEEAIGLANQTMYGLAAALWTRDIDLALSAAKSLRAGTVWINSFHSTGIRTMPFGGYKQSGLGREFGMAGLNEYLETKSVQIKMRPLSAAGREVSLG